MISVLRGRAEARGWRFHLASLANLGEGEWESREVGEDAGRGAGKKKGSLGDCHICLTT